jgi:hypothetical protein
MSTLINAADHKGGGFNGGGGGFARTETEFLNVIETKGLRVFLFAIHNHL